MKITNNTNNLARVSNYKIFLPILSENIQYAQGVSLPGFALNPVPAYNKSSLALKLEGDSLTLDPISISLILDENYNLYKRLLKIFEGITHPSSGIKNPDFNFNCGIEITNNTGLKVFAIEFYQCALQSIAPINLLSNTDDDIITLDLTIEASYYEIVEEIDKEKLQKILKS